MLLKFEECFLVTQMIKIGCMIATCLYFLIYKIKTILKDIFYLFQRTFDHIEFKI